MLAIIGSHLPSALRICLLTLAVVDDLLAISIIAVFYASDIQAGPLLPALLAAALLVGRIRQYRAVQAEEGIAIDRDGIPDVYQEDRHP
ncbi:Na+/H+ antiporter NhaA [Arthrobacter sp. UYEF6]